MKKEYIQNRENEIKKLDMKKLPLFLGFIIACAVAGYFVGRLIFKAGDLSGFSSGIASVMRIACPVLLVFAAVSCAVMLPMLAKLIKKAKAWDGEEEGYIDDIENGISVYVEISNVLMVVSFFLMATGCYLLKDADKLSALNIILIAAFCVSLVEIVLVQHRALSAEQLINPEKRGSFFDMRFASVHEQSFDEMEKLVLYKAAYKAHRAVQLTCMLCWLLAFVLQLLFSCGVLPVCFVTAIWLVNTVVMGRQTRLLSGNGGDK